MNQQQPGKTGQLGVADLGNSLAISRNWRLAMAHFSGVFFGRS